MTPALRATLRDTSPLPDGWSALEIVEDTVVVDGVELRRAGLASIGPEGEEITGSGAEALESPVRRSYFELLERVAILEALRHKSAEYALRTVDGEPAGLQAAEAVFPESDDPVRWRYARSNGVALHANWRAACTRARWELAERDRVLRAWYGEIRPARLPFPPASSPLRETRSYEWSAYAFPEPDPTSFSVGVEVVGVFGFPITPLAPLVMGFAARADAPGALDAATTEAMQLLAFLWGEALPESPPALGPTAAQHLDHFQWHGRHPALRRWLDGAHTEHASRAGRTNAVASEVAFLDLTPDWLGGGLRVAKAICPAAMPLIFGDSPFGRHLPQELRAHPIA